MYELLLFLTGLVLTGSDPALLCWNTSRCNGWQRLVLRHSLKEELGCLKSGTLPWDLAVLQLAGSCAVFYVRERLVISQLGDQKYGKSTPGHSRVRDKRAQPLVPVRFWCPGMFAILSNREAQRAVQRACYIWSTKLFWKATSGQVRRLQALHLILVRLLSTSELSSLAALGEAISGP